MRSPAKLPAVISASGAYYAAHALVIAAGVVSMPIMTRLLSKSEYGLLGLVYLTASVFALIGGMGFGEAAVRLYQDHRAEGPRALRNLCGTLAVGAFVASTLVAVSVGLIGSRLAQSGPSPYLECLPLACTLVVIRSVSVVLNQIYRAQERAGAHAFIQVSVRYATLVVAISFLLVFRRDAFTAIVATVVVEVVSLVLRLLDLWRRGVISIPTRGQAPFGTAIAYGLPLALAGSARFLLDYADRFMIERALGLDAVATYGVPYDLAAKLGDSLATPIHLAAMPIIFRLWLHHGPAETSRFTSDVLNYMIAFALPFGAIYLLYSEELIVLLASAKYRGAGSLTAYILPGVLLSNFNFVVIAGLTVKKRTVVLAITVCAAALLNVVLNLVLIPSFELVGAAVATTVSYAALIVANYVLGGDTIDLRLHYGTLLRALLATAAAILLLHVLGLLQPASPMALVVGGALGTASAIALFVALDPRLRQLARSQLAGGPG